VRIEFKPTSNCSAQYGHPTTADVCLEDGTTCRELYLYVSQHALSSYRVSTSNDDGLQLNDLFLTNYECRIHPQGVGFPSCSHIQYFAFFSPKGCIVQRIQSVLLTEVKVTSTHRHCLHRRELKFHELATWLFPPLFSFMIRWPVKCNIL